MAKAYSEDMRKRVIDKKNQGKTTKEIMEDLQVSETFVYSVLRNYLLINQITVIWKKSGRKPKLSKVQLDEILQMILKQPDSTLEEIKQTLDLKIAISTLFYIIRDCLNFRYKKTLHAKEQLREDVVSKRNAWKKAQSCMNKSKLIFLDETSINAGMTRLYGRAYEGRKSSRICAF